MTRFQTFDDIENAVLAEVIAWPERTLALAPDLELDDFGDPFRRSAFGEIRNLEAARAPIHVVAVGDALFASWQRANDGKCTDHDAAGLFIRLATVMFEAPKYGRDFDRLFPQHIRQLRILAESRRIRMRAS